LLPTARGGFLLVNYCSTKDICCAFTYNTFRNFANDFKKCFHDYHLLPYLKERRVTTNHPHNFVATLFKHFHNLKTYQFYSIKKRGSQIQILLTLPLLSYPSENVFVTRTISRDMSFVRPGTYFSMGNSPIILMLMVYIGPTPKYIPLINAAIPSTPSLLVTGKPTIILPSLLNLITSTSSTPLNE
jgi:hypothetical protein